MCFLLLSSLYSETTYEKLRCLLHPIVASSMWPPLFRQFQFADKIRKVTRRRQADCGGINFFLPLIKMEGEWRGLQECSALQAALASPGGQGLEASYGARVPTYTKFQVNLVYIDREIRVHRDD